MNVVKYPSHNESLNETIYVVAKNFIYFFTTVLNFKFWTKISRKFNYRLTKLINVKEFLKKFLYA